MSRAESARGPIASIPTCPNTRHSWPLAFVCSSNENGCERNRPDAHQTERPRLRNDLKDIAAFGCEVKFSIRILAE